MINVTYRLSAESEFGSNMYNELRPIMSLREDIQGTDNEHPKTNGIQKGVVA